MIIKEPPDAGRQHSSSLQLPQNDFKQEEVKQNLYKIPSKLRKEKKMQAEIDNLEKDRGFSQPNIDEIPLSHKEKTKKGQEND